MHFIIVLTSLITTHEIQSPIGGGVLFHHMLDDLPVFEDPRTGAHFRSKNYVSFEMPEGYSAYEYLGLPMPPMPKLTHIRQGDDLITPRAIVSIDGLGKMVSNYKDLPMLFRSTKVEVHSDSNKEKSQPKVVDVRCEN